MTANTINQNEATISNAEAIIERFGGIRPMASKISVPVTTVQGWKKRNVIPLARLEQIKTAAREHNVDISDILSAAPVANENARIKEQTTKQTGVHTFERDLKDAVISGAGTHKPDVIPPVIYDNLADKLSKAEQTAIAKSTAINVVFMLVTVAAVVLLLWPSASVNSNQEVVRLRSIEQNLTQLENKVENVQKNIPPDIAQRLEQIQQPPAAPVPDSPKAAYGPADETLAQRLARLEANVSAMAGSPAIADIVTRFELLKTSPEGQDQLARAWEALAGYVAGFQGDPAAFESGLEGLRGQNPDLAKIFTGVPPADLRKAAMVFGFSQLSSLLNLDNVPFAGDMNVVKSLIGVDYPELAMSLESLAAQAAQGVLTPSTLTAEFTGLAGDVVSASLKGENVSLTERAMAHLNNFIQVQKGGELVSGTPTQAAVSRMQNALTRGDIEGAIRAAQGLSGPAASVVAPWVSKAQVTLKAQQLKATLGRTINAQAYGRGVTTMDAPLVGGAVTPYSRP